MDPLTPTALTLSPAIAEIYERASQLRESMKPSTPTQLSQSSMTEENKAKQVKLERDKEAARMVLETPERLRVLVAEGKMEEARGLWEGVLSVLERWKSEGRGGEDVQDCIDDGEAALRGDPPGEKSWVNLRDRK
jgi:hypothetical protein